MQEQIKTYAEFFPYYLKEHSKPACRALHYIGTTLALMCWLKFILTLDYMWVGLGLVAGYGFAWIGHFGIEKNRPATFQYPFWSFISDFRMYGLWITGRLDKPLKKALEG